MSEPTDSTTTDLTPSCLERTSRKEFLQKVIHKAKIAGTILSGIAIKEIVIHPTLSAVATLTVTS